MKVNIKIFVISLLLCSYFMAGCSNSKQSLASVAKKPVIGVVMGRFNDTWRTSVRNELYELAQDKAEIDIWSGDNSQITENQKIDLLISRNVNVLVVNLVEATGAAPIIGKAKKANIPVIFFNVEPSSEDMKRWDKVYYVGAKGEQSGVLQGEMLVNYFKSHPTEDGIIHYVMLKGPSEHQDAISRSKYSIKAMEDASFKVEKLSEDIAMWEREEAQEKMQNFLAAEGANIDCVIANNDDMALGAIDALKDKGYFKDGKYMPVVGVDATSSAVNALKDNTLLGTVLNDAVGQGKAIFDLASILSSGQTPNKSNFNNTITDNKYVWIDYKVITKESIGNAK